MTKPSLAHMLGMIGATSGLSHTGRHVVNVPDKFYGHLGENGHGGKMKKAKGSPSVRAVSRGRNVYVGQTIIKKCTSRDKARAYAKTYNQR